MKNWWYYHKWYVICGAILLGILCDLVGSAFGLWEKKPDFQIAYVGKTQLPQDTVEALEQAFASIGGDFNGDGKTIVKVNQYVSNSQVPDADAAYYEYISEITLIGDISDCESYFFLMDDPDSLQRGFQILASADGSCPGEMDDTAGVKTILWSDCSILSNMDLGAYSSVILGQEQTGNNQELLSGLYLGRRCFYTDALSDNSDQCSQLWDYIIGSSIQ